MTRLMAPFLPHQLGAAGVKQLLGALRGDEVDQSTVVAVQRNWHTSPSTLFSAVGALGGLLAVWKHFAWSGCGKEFFWSVPTLPMDGA